MNPENLTSDALTLFNRLGAEARREAVLLTESLSENEAVYLAAMRHMGESERREMLFVLSRERWGL